MQQKSGSFHLRVRVLIVSVSVVEKFIAEIDQLPPRFKDVETLFLSNNSITTLNGIEQFPVLRVLSIANNLVRVILRRDPFDLTHVHQSDRHIW